MGEYKQARISRQLENLALEAASAVEADVARIDISPEGPRVVNIELNPNLTIPSKASGVNIPERMMASIYDNFEAHMKKPLFVKLVEDARSAVKDMLRTKHFI